MSRRVRGGEIARRAVAEFVVPPAGLTRALSRSVSELTRDRFQARRAIRRDVQPRCTARGRRPLLRWVTNGALRDLNTILVAQHMLRGTRSIYVDYVDYDEIAHHAGMLRPESLEALEAVDDVLHQLELVAAAAPRRYRFVVLSDHGQAQGSPFADRYGEDLAAVVARLAAVDVAASDDDVEGWGRTRALVDELASGSGVGGRSMQQRSARWTSATATSPTRSRRRDTGDGSRRQGQGRHAASGDETFHVFGSGNLGLVYVRGEKQRARPTGLDRAVPRPRRRPGRPPGRRFRRRDGRRRAGRARQDGWHRLDDGHVEGRTRCSRSGPTHPEFVKRAAHRPEAPDIYVNSLSTPAPRRSPPSRTWSAVTAGSVAGRTAPASWSHRPAVPGGAGRRGRRDARGPARHPSPLGHRQDVIEPGDGAFRRHRP